MKPGDRDAANLQDMLEAAREARDLVAEIRAEVFLHDRVRTRALERLLELVGEAARRITPEFQAAHPEIEWRRIIGQRNVLAHEYGPDQSRASLPDGEGRHATPDRRTGTHSSSVIAVSAKLCIVLDTNVWLDWLVFDDPLAAPIKAAVAANRVEVFIDAACEAELERVLAYDLGKRTPDAAAQADCIAECRRVAQRIDLPMPQAERTQLPVCRDPDDQKFLEAAHAARAAFLVTRDRALLELTKRAAPFRIVSPAAFADVWLIGAIMQG